MQSTLSTLFTPAQKERLRAAVPLRTSCRSFSAAPDLQTAAALAYQAGRFTLPGVSLHLISVSEDVFTNITGCCMAAAVSVSQDNWRSRLHAGISGEAFILEATAMGVGTCWVGGSFRRTLVEGAVPPGETLLCLIALGIPPQPLSAPVSRPRMAPDQLCLGAWRLWPQPFTDAAALVQIAPSGMNQQPWKLLRTPQGDFALDAPLRSTLDAGIALCHAELALMSPHTWRFSDKTGEPLATTVFR